MGLETVSNALILVALGACVAITGSLAYKSLPMRLERRARELANEWGDIRDAWTRTKADLEVLMEQLEAQSETLEKRRARVTAENRRAGVLKTSDGEESLTDLRRRAGLL